jgi:hypothetical protein
MSYNECLRHLESTIDDDGEQDMQELCTVTPILLPRRVTPSERYTPRRLVPGPAMRCGSGAMLEF